MLLVLAAIVAVAAVGLGFGAVYLVMRPTAATPHAAASQSPSDCDPPKLKLAGCARDAPPYDPPPAGTAVDPNTATACDLNEKMRNSTNDLVTQGDTITRIQQLTADTNSDVRFAGNMLKDRYDLAAAARQNHLDETADDLNLLTASINLSTACINAGWHAGG
jgi:hypothetical protein